MLGGLQRDAEKTREAADELARQLEDERLAQRRLRHRIRVYEDWVAVQQRALSACIVHLAPPRTPGSRGSRRRGGSGGSGRTGTPASDGGKTVWRDAMDPAAGLLGADVRAL